MSRIFDFLRDDKSTSRTFVNLDRVLVANQVGVTTGIEVELGGGVSVTIPVQEVARFVNAWRGLL